MAEPKRQDLRLERQLRLGIRLVFYPLAIGLIALAWQRTHPKTVSFSPVTRGPASLVQPFKAWVGVTGQGHPVWAETVDGVLTSLTTSIVTHCRDGSTWTLRLTMFAGRFTRAGDIVNGRQGPARGTSDQGEPVRVTTRVRTKMSYPVGTIVSEVTRSPGPHSVHCRSYEVDYALNRELGPRANEPCSLLSLCFPAYGFRI